MFSTITAKISLGLVVALAATGLYAFYLSSSLSSLKSSFSDLQASYSTLQSEKNQLQTSFNNYATGVVASQLGLQKVMDRLTEVDKGLKNAIKSIEVYPSTPVLDTPYPDDYLRLFRESGSVSSPRDPKASSANNSTSLQVH